MDAQSRRPLRWVATWRPNIVVEILLPTPPLHVGEPSKTFDVGRSIRGVTVGLRLDHAWRSYIKVVGVWEELLQRDGAMVQRLWTGERVGTPGEQTRSDIDAWSRLVECAVIGLGN